MVSNLIGMPRRLFRKAVQQGRSERRGESYSVPYVEPLSDATCLREAAPAKAGNAAGGLCQQPASDTRMGWW